MTVERGAGTKLKLRQLRLDSVPSYPTTASKRATQNASVNPFTEHSQDLELSARSRKSKISAKPLSKIKWRDYFNTQTFSELQSPRHQEYLVTEHAKKGSQELSCWEVARGNNSGNALAT